MCVSLESLTWERLDNHCSTQPCLQIITSSRLCEWDVNDWQHMVCSGNINRCCFVTNAGCCGMSYTLKHHPTAGALLTFCSLINCLLHRSPVKVYSMCLNLSLLWHVWCQTKVSWKESKLLSWHLLICFISLQSKWQIKRCSCGTSAWLTRQLVFMAPSGNSTAIVVKK